MSWMNIITESNKLLDSEAAISQNYENILLDAFNEIITFDILELKKINYDFFKNVKINQNNKFYNFYCQPELIRFVNDRKNLYLSALKEHVSHTMIVNSDDSYIYISIDNKRLTEMYGITKFLDIAYDKFRNEFL